MHALLPLLERNEHGGPNFECHARTAPDGYIGRRASLEAVEVASKQTAWLACTVDARTTLNRRVAVRPLDRYVIPRRPKWGT